MLATLVDFRSFRYLVVSKDNNKSDVHPSGKKIIMIDNIIRLNSYQWTSVCEGAKWNRENVNTDRKRKKGKMRSFHSFHISTFQIFHIVCKFI